MRLSTWNFSIRYLISWIESVSQAMIMTQVLFPTNREIELSLVGVKNFIVYA